MEFPPDYAERIAAFQAYFTANAFAMDDGARLAECRRLLRELVVDEHYIREKLAEIDRLLAVFFSSRRHQAFDGGADEVYRRIVHSLLPRVRQQAKNHGTLN